VDIGGVAYCIVDREMERRGGGRGEKERKIGYDEETV
jgi:hypothetical protein